MARKTSVTCDGCGETVEENTPYYALSLVRPLVQRDEAKMFQVLPDICDDCASLLRIIVKKHSLKRWFYRTSVTPEADPALTAAVTRNDIGQKEG